MAEEPICDGDVTVKLHSWQVLHRMEMAWANTPTGLLNNAGGSKQSLNVLNTYIQSFLRHTLPRSWRFEWEEMTQIKLQQV